MSSPRFVLRSTYFFVFQKADPLTLFDVNVLKNFRWNSPAAASPVPPNRLPHALLPRYRIRALTRRSSAWRTTVPEQMSQTLFLCSTHRRRAWMRVTRTRTGRREKWRVATGAVRRRAAACRVSCARAVDMYHLLASILRIAFPIIVCPRIILPCCLRLSFVRTAHCRELAPYISIKLLPRYRTPDARSIPCSFAVAAMTALYPRGLRRSSSERATVRRAAPWRTRAACRCCSNER
mmetsp:Transcript_19563/g.47384  ORF Transcript_19563/g.47384 Transcript_19563/m.47384 type:complete len:236 (-) Transcript_19563:135-842(-)